LHASNAKRPSNPGSNRHHVPEAWKLAPHLADANLSDAHLARFAEAAGASVGSELTRFATLLEMDRIAEELENSSARISDLIRAIKEYPTWTKAPCRRWTSSTVSKTRSRSCITS